jgi:hypothetical protein
MLKVFGFTRRNPQLSHDDYRASHVGYHNSYGRRLNNIRGYILNVRANRSIEQVLGTAGSELARGAPPAFDDLWDAWGQLMFDNLDAYLSAKTPARDRAGPNGLEDDPKVAQVGGDGAHLYGGSPFQFHVLENVAIPVKRPERKIFKLVQFGKRPDSLTQEEFQAYWTGRYAAHIAQLPGIRGHIINFRTDLDVMTDFFEPDADAFTPEGTAVRQTFFDAWDGIAELWFDTPEQFVSARCNSESAAALTSMEQELFASVFYREVDETIAVLPNRAPAPSFYHR